MTAYEAAPDAPKPASLPPTPDQVATTTPAGAPAASPPAAAEAEKPVPAAPAVAGKAAGEAAGKAAPEGAGKAAAAPAAAAAKPAAPAAKAPAAAASGKAAPAADGMTRRGFFSWAAVAWVGFTAAIGGCATAMGRFMFPNVLFEPPTSFKAGPPSDIPPGTVDTRFVDEYGVWIANDGARLYALIAICTHLGCPPAWLEAQNKFKCPCHGSGYYRTGINFEGPTPRPLERARIFVSPEDGQIVVDKAQKFQWELGQWEDPASFIAVG